MEVWCLIALVSSGHCILPKIWPLGHCVLWLVWGMCNTGLGYCILSAVDDHGSMMEVVEIWESWLLAAGIACSAFSESYLYLRFCVVQCASLCWTASKLLMRLILLHLETNKEHCYSTSLTLWLWQLLCGSIWQWFGVHLQDWPGSCLLCWLKSPRIIISNTYGRINITLYSFYGGLVRWFFGNSVCVFLYFIYYHDDYRLVWNNGLKNIFIPSVNEWRQRQRALIYWLNDCAFYLQCSVHFF